MKITKSAKVEVEIDPFELGKIFADMYDDEQAEFFNGVATATKDWPKDASFQWQSLRNKLDGSLEGLKAFKGMAKYGYD